MDLTLATIIVSNLPIAREWAGAVLRLAMARAEFGAQLLGAYKDSVLQSYVLKKPTVSGLPAFGPHQPTSGIRAFKDGRLRVSLTKYTDGAVNVFIYAPSGSIAMTPERITIRPSPTESIYCEYGQTEQFSAPSEDRTRSVAPSEDRTRSVAPSEDRTLRDAPFIMVVRSRHAPVAYELCDPQIRQHAQLILALYHGRNDIRELCYIHALQC